MTKYAHLAYIAGIAILIIGLGVAIVAWHQNGIDKARAEATAAAKEEAIAVNQRTLDQREKDWEAQKADFQRQIDSIKTVAQARQALQPIILSSPIPQQQVTKAELPAEIQRSLPDAPASTKYTLFTDPQIVELGKYKAACDETTAELTKCKADKLTLADSLKKSEEKTPAVKRTFFSGLRSGISHAVCGGGGTAAGMEVSKKNSVTTGLLIGGGTFVGCELFAHIRTF